MQFVLISSHGNERLISSHVSSIVLSPVIWKNFSRSLLYVPLYHSHHSILYNVVSSGPLTKFHEVKTLFIVITASIAGSL